MRTIRASLWLGLSAFAFSALPACADDCEAVVADGWVRLPPMAMPMMAGFARIENDCAEPLVITGASSPAFAEVALHRSSIVDGISRMRAVPELHIAAEDTAVLEPGGLHLMLMQPREPLQAGSSVTVEFALEGGGVMRGEFEVRAPGE